MPTVKTLPQESENSGEASYIHGHHHGVLGILAGWVKRIFCVPLYAELHERTRKLRDLQNKSVPVLKGKDKVSVTTLLASMAIMLVKGLNTDTSLY